MQTADEQEFKSKLLEGAQVLKIQIGSLSLEKLLKHFRILRKWAERMNLTTVLDPEGMAERLYLDSALLSTKLEPSTRVHDVGTGAGFPGLVLKALCPSLKVTLTEARRKKVSFLRQAAREMQLEEGLEIRWARLGWEGDQATNQKEEWPELVSRATFPVEEWIRIGSLHVAPLGRLWIFSGPPHGQGELEAFEDHSQFSAALPKDFILEEKLTYVLPFSNKKRFLVSLRRVKEQ